VHLLDVSKPVEQEAPHAQPMPELPPSVVTSVTFKPDGSEIALTLNSAQAANDAYSLDLRARKLVRWTHSETNGIDLERLPLPELVHWHSFDGKLIPGFLYRPPARFTGKRPVVINIHGGPEGQSLPRFLGQFNYYLDELGVAVIFPNVRGSTGYGKTYVDLDNGLLREDSYKDIGALLDWITTQPELDSDRIMVMGGSYGGHMTLVAATRYAGRIRCALDIVGMSNLVTFLERTEKYRQDLRRAEYGDERDPKMRAFLESIAPLNHVDKITKPLFVVQGKNDPRVPYTEAEQIVSAVQKRGVPVWYLMANDEGHGFVKKQSSDYLFYSTILFMQRYLLAN
jgi:dipeptidyl aminopeptidase/acylaminoacyl peptidase